MSRTVMEFSGFRLEPERRRLTDPEGEAQTLRARDFETLVALVERAGTPVSKEELIATVWPGSVVEENNLNQAISKLRQILGDDRYDPKFIATLPGRGYQFIAPVRQLTADEAKGAGEATGNRRWRIVLAAVGLAVLAAVALWWSNDTGQAPSTVISLEAGRLVTQSPSSNSNPALSGDGTFMAFVSDRSGTPQIWVKGLPDGKPIQITEGERAAASPAWSPVDDTILFQRPDDDGTPAIWRTDALRSNPATLIQRRAVTPRFAGGRSFTFSKGYSSVYVATLDGNDTRRIDGIPKTPGF
ncbi:MAG: winged helix-turn-helix domain-containing protein, partial [Pseudomonadota bacterium]